jgi:hypothetical protein
VLPDWREPSHPLRGAPLEAFIAAIEEVLADPDVEVLISSPRDVQERFSRVGAKTKQGVADYLADEFPELHAILPMPRQNSDRERQAMSVFDALAFALAVQADRLDAEDHARS